MKRSAVVGVPMMVIAYPVALTWGANPFAAFWAVGAMFYLWGMVLAAKVQYKRYEDAWKTCFFMPMSEFAEGAYMIWVIFSWVTYFVARPTVSSA